MNLRALRLLYPQATLHGIEINPDAALKLEEFLGEENVQRGSILEITPPISDLALIKTVLIHMDPQVLPKIYDKLVRATRRYLLDAEYYNPNAVAIPYRGHTNRLFKRDFAGEIMDRHPEMTLIDYGFIYRNDPKFPQDDITWFLMEKL